MNATRRRPAMAAPDVARVGAHLRQLLACPGLHLAAPGRGQTVQLRVGHEMVGTVDPDEDGDWVVTIPVLRDELMPG